jgi:hypothetical protein
MGVQSGIVVTLILVVIVERILSLKLAKKRHVITNTVLHNRGKVLRSTISQWGAIAYYISTISQRSNLTSRL